MLFLVQPAIAGNRTAQEKAARKACLNGDYVKGVSILSDLFVDTTNVTYIFNQGRCLEQNKRYEDAIEKFKEYLRAGGESLTREERQAGQKHLDDCKATVAEERATLAPTPPPPTPPTSAPTPAPAPMPVAEPAPPVLTQPAVTVEASRPGSGLRIAGIAAASIGVVGIATGVLLNLKANSMVNQMQTTPGDYTHSKDNNRQSYETFAWIAYGAGAGCLATGAILYTIGLKSRASNTDNFALVPAVAPRQAGVLLTGSF